MKPNGALLGRWLHSWVQPDGAIHGFHNHSVWGDNPYRYGDFTAGHSTFASPMLLGLAHALAQRPDPRGRELLERLLHFQTTRFQPDEQFAHIGFQVGETLTHGLIHNVVPCVALSRVAALSNLLHDEIDRAVRRVLAACDRLHGPGPSEHTCCNQEYCRLWARLLHMQAFEHREWHDLTAAGLDYMIEHFHVRGCPDDECAGTWRVLSDHVHLEPAEYYGLMIAPLLLGYQRYGQRRYLEAARAIAQHVARSSWTDGRGQRRFHRLWARVNDEWINQHEPMLIGGMGFTLAGIESLVKVEPDAELAAFLAEADETYAHYQSRAGFFLAGTGWGGEQDIIPSTAWQSHDFCHLVARHGVTETFWDTLFQSDPHVAVVLGQSLVWLEAGPHWAVRGYDYAHGLELVGRKDRARFGVDIPAWIKSGREMPGEYQMPDQPKFLRANDAIRHLSGRTDLRVLAAGGLPYIGPTVP